MGDEGEPVKAPVKVYRIEMPNGNGPYNSCLPNAKEIRWGHRGEGCIKDVAAHTCGHVQWSIDRDINHCKIIELREMADAA